MNVVNKEHNTFIPHLSKKKAQAKIILCSFFVFIDLLIFEVVFHFLFQPYASVDTLHAGLTLMGRR